MLKETIERRLDNTGNDKFLFEPPDQAFAVLGPQDTLHLIRGNRKISSQLAAVNSLPLQVLGIDDGLFKLGCQVHREIDIQADLIRLEG